MYHIGIYVSVYIGRYACPMYILHMSFYKDNNSNNKLSHLCDIIIYIHVEPVIMYHIGSYVSDILVATRIQCTYCTCPFNMFNEDNNSNNKLSRLCDIYIHVKPVIMY